MNLPHPRSVPSLLPPNAPRASRLPKAILHGLATAALAQFAALNASAVTAQVANAPSQGGGFTGGGITGNYYPGQNLDNSGTVTPAFTRTDVRVDFNFNQGSIVQAPGGVNDVAIASVGNSNWSARWTGNFIPKYSDIYTFTVTGDDGYRLYIDGNLVINDWVAQAPTTNTARIALTAGTTHSIELDYFQTYGGAVIQLHWSAPEFPDEAIQPATPIGIGIGGTDDWEGSQHFANILMNDRGFGVSGTPWTANAPENTQGWPTTDFGLITMDWGGKDGAPPASNGTYHVTFNGIAVISPIASSFTQHPLPHPSLPTIRRPPPPSRAPIHESSPHCAAISTLTVVPVLPRRTSRATDFPSTLTLTS